MNKIMKAVCGAVIMSGFALLCGWVVAPGWAQDASPAGRQTQSPSQSVQQKADSNAPLGTPLQQHRQERIEIEAALKTLREAKTDADKQAAKDSLRKALAAIFSDDMQARAREVKEIETRLEKLRQQYQARENAKDEIIELQLKVLEKNADGLEFPLRPRKKSLTTEPLNTHVPHP
jgi:hypothetical protein